MRHFFSLFFLTGGSRSFFYFLLFSEVSLLIEVVAGTGDFLGAIIVSH